MINRRAAPASATDLVPDPPAETWLAVNDAGSIVGTYYLKPNARGAAGSAA
jgi:hypothetical protein